MDGLLQGLAWGVAAIEFIANAATAAIGVATIYAFFRYRRRVSAALRLAKLHHLNDRRNEIRETLSLISLTAIEKGRSLQLRALFGRLNGQLLPLCAVLPELGELQLQAHAIAHENGKLNEAIKQQFVHQVEAQFESCRLQSLGEATGDNR